MKPLSEQDHYEILEIPRASSSADIERAYRLVRATYAEDSLAGYSVVGEGDADAVRERIEIAFRVLSDEGLRRSYDASLAAVEPEPAPRQPEPTAAPPDSQAEAEAEALESFDEQRADFDGGLLRRARMRRGLELEDVARVTKVNPAYLRFIEEERFADLPARVYVRGFVCAYASCLGLAPKGIAEAYMRRYDARGAAR